MHILFRIFPDPDRKGYSYVIDRGGNKIFYGTRYQCLRFIEFMQGE